MSEAALQRKPVTVGEFLRWEDGTDRRYELIRGEIVMMAPAAQRHGALAGQLCVSLGSRLRRPCRVYSEGGILLPERDEDFYVADVAVSCAPMGVEQWCQEPRLVVEVLSPSTRAKVRGTKLVDYRRIPSLADILLVESTRIGIEHYARAGDLWVVRDLGPGGVVRLEGLGVEIPVDEIYADLGLETPAA